jgi:serine/threonine protein kinase
MFKKFNIQCSKKVNCVENVYKIMRHLSVYEEMETLGTGGFCEVKEYKCMDVHSDNIICNKRFVVKKMLQKKVSKQCQRYIEKMMLNEYLHCSILRNENIIRALDFNNDIKHVVFEHFVGIDLFDYLNAHSNSEINKILGWYSQLLDAVDYIHTNAVAHMDIKLENIVVNLTTSQVKLIDFGNAIHFQDNETHWVMCGTDCYMSPEMVLYNGYFPDKSDVWCCGLVLYNILYDKMPWKNSTSALFRKACVSFECNDLDNSIFPEHPYLHHFKNIFIGTLKPDPTKRMNIKQVRSMYHNVKLD